MRLSVIAVVAGCAGATPEPVPFVFDTSTLPVALRAEAAPVATAYAASPDDACVLYQVASILARAGRRGHALATLRRMAALGTGVDPRIRDFVSLADTNDFAHIGATIRAANPPVLRAHEAFAIHEGDLVPEGIAWSATTRRLYLGSTKRKIISVDRAGHVEPFVAPATGGLGVVLGVRVDDARGELWAASDRLGDTPADAVTGLFRFRLADGALLASYPVGELVNDIAVAPDGRAYATLTESGAIVRVDP